jgi:uncharacterized membrane protein YagU involved in acid resistance
MIVAAGALAVGTLDILDAIGFFGLYRHVAPMRIFQSIASGLLGKAAFSGGTATAILGGVLHFEIATVIVFVYYAATRWIPDLAKRALLWGPLYGVAVYVVMNAVVIPLSAATGGMPKLPVLINGLAIHILGVGIPSALTARAARRFTDR